jgi:hypothetical protein
VPFRAATDATINPATFLINGVAADTITGFEVLGYSGQSEGSGFSKVGLIRFPYSGSDTTVTIRPGFSATTIRSGVGLWEIGNGEMVESVALTMYSVSGLREAALEVFNGSVVLMGAMLAHSATSSPVQTGLNLRETIAVETNSRMTFASKAFHEYAEEWPVSYDPGLDPAQGASVAWMVLIPYEASP